MESDFQRLYKLSLQVDKLISKVDTHYKKPYASKEEYKRYKKQRKNMRRKIGKLRARVMNSKKDIHCKISRHITLNNKHIMISRFQVSQMTRLKHKAEEMDQWFMKSLNIILARLVGNVVVFTFLVIIFIDVQSGIIHHQFLTLIRHVFE